MSVGGTEWCLSVGATDRPTDCLGDSFLHGQSGHLRAGTDWVSTHAGARSKRIDGSVVDPLPKTCEMPEMRSYPTSGLVWPLLLAITLASQATSSAQSYDTYFVSLENVKFSRNRNLYWVPADLTGDGNFEFLIKDQSAGNDPSVGAWQTYSETMKLHALRSDGSRMWTHDYGWGVVQGIWYSPVYAYDADEDGRTEVYLKGVKNYTGPTPPSNGMHSAAFPGTEVIYKLDPETGGILAEAPWPERVSDYAGMTNPRNHIYVIHIDSGSGIKPHIVALRGKYARMQLNIYDSDLKIVAQWKDTDEPITRFQTNYTPHAWVSDYFDTGGSVLVAGDLDGDGQDEIVLGSAALKASLEDGQVTVRGLWSVKGNIDGCYVGDINWDEPGLEVWVGSERYPVSMLVRGADGSAIFRSNAGQEGERMVADLDGETPGLEINQAKTRNHYADGRSSDTNWGIVSEKHHDMALWWDGTHKQSVPGSGGIPGTRRIDCGYTADIMGDWREEIILQDRTNDRLVIYSPKGATAINPGNLRKDRIYRMSAARGNFGMTGYFHRPMLSVPIFMLIDAGNPFAPIFASHPKRTTALIGGSASFTARAVGDPAVSYQWLKNGTPIPNATAATLTIQAVVQADAADYSVRVSNARGTLTSPGVPLRVFTAVTLGDDALARWEMAGTDRRDFTPPAVIATGISASPVRMSTAIWRQSLGPDEDGLVGTRATRESLAQSLSDEVYFTVRLTPSAGAIMNVTSVRFRPISQNQDRVFHLFSSRNGFMEADEIGRVNISRTNSGAALVAIPVAEHTGIDGEVEFRIYVSGTSASAEVVGFGRGSSDDFAILGTVTPLGDPSPPVILENPRSVEVTEGSAAAFTVVSTGNPFPSFQWRHNGNPIPNAVGPSLTVPNVDQFKIGLYDVVLTNTLGTAVSSPVTLSLSQMPDTVPEILTSFLQHGTVGADYEVTFSAILGNGALVWSATGLPDWATLNPETAVLSGRPTGPGAHEISISVTDADGDTDARIFALVVDPAPPPPSPGVVASWDFEGTNGNSSSPPNLVSPGVDISPASFGPGLDAFLYAGGGGLTARRQTMDTLAGAIADGEYIGFTVVPNGGFAVTVSELVLRPVSQNRLRTFSVLSSLAGFHPSAVLGSIQATGNAANEDSVVRIADHTNLTGPVEFRIYIYGFTDQYESVGLGRASGPDLSIRGEVSVWEDNTTDFQAWIQRHFTPSQQIDLSISGDDASPLGDGLTNRMRFAMGVGPFERWVPLQAKSRLANGLPGFRFTVNAESDETEVTVEVSRDLRIWHQDPNLYYLDSMGILAAEGANSERFLFEVGPAAVDSDALWFVRLSFR